MDWNRICQYTPLYIVIIFIVTGCGRNATSDQKQEVSHIELAKTQSILMTQDFSYDAHNPNKISGPYVSRDKLEMPKNVNPQNKWSMFEGPVLENDLVAYRYYADNRHRFDIYGKIVSDLVMDTVSWDYHGIMDWGSDILKVGNSLGIGSPAIQSNDSLYTLSDWDSKVIEKVDIDSDISMIRTTFTNLRVDGHTFDMIQDWSIEPGKPWSKIQLKVIDGHLPTGLKFATGIAKHLPDIIEGDYKGHFYAYNWGKQSFHGENMGMGIITDQSSMPIGVNDELNHAYVFDQAQSEVTYWFLSAWERDNNLVKSSDEFKALIESLLL